MESPQITVDIPSPSPSPSPAVWISLTTIPSRLERILTTLASLKQQTYPVTRMNLCLPDLCQKQNRGYDLPPALLEDSAITVVKCGTDWGPATKLLGSLAVCTDPDTLIITVDDDIIYAPDIVEKLVARHLAHPHAAIGFCGWYAYHAKKDRGEMYANLVYEDRRPEIAFMTAVDVLEGYRGVLTRRDFWDDAVFDYQTAPPESRFVDDVWLSGHLARRKIPRLAFRYDPDRSLDFDTTYYKIWTSNFNGAKKDNDSLSCRDNFYEENVATIRYFEQFDPTIWYDAAFHIPPTQQDTPPDDGGEQQVPPQETSAEDSPDELFSKPEIREAPSNADAAGLSDHHR